MPEPITLVAVGGGLTGLMSHLARRYFDVSKEVLDIVLGTIAFVLCVPLLAVCALIVKVSSDGPVFFKQVRAGKAGRPFTMYKLRTMYADAEAGIGAVWATDEDPRVIGACRWMRHAHVDELPQLLNVIKGEMSLVGPRPERPEILEQLERTYPNIRERLAVRPGITGLAQIRNGYDTSVESFQHKLQADLEYIRGRRWGLEPRIRAATLARFHDKQAK